jgi:hypothetical protein
MSDIKSNLSDPEFLRSAVMNGESVDDIPFETSMSVPFPVHAFNKSLAQVINDAKKYLGYPVDYFGSAVLFAASVAIGNTHRVAISDSYEQTAVIYLALVGKPGTNKSHPPSRAIYPIVERDRRAHCDYLAKLEAYNAEMGKLSPKERRESDTPKPVLKRLLVSDITPEALVQLHEQNLRGLGNFHDELIAWIKNFNRYNTGSEEQFWLSNWSGKFVMVDRKLSGHTRIDHPFISVAGTIQPDTLREMAKDRTGNGFLDRILFAMPDNARKEYWNKNSDLFTTGEVLDNAINRLLDLEIRTDKGSKPYRVLRFAEQARSTLDDWQRMNTDLANQASDDGNDAIAGIYVKIEQYAIRFCLLLEMLSYGCRESDGNIITERSVNGALLLAEYFASTAIRIHAMISNNDPLAGLAVDRIELYHALPEKFTMSDGLEVARRYECPERTFKGFVKRNNLFRRLKQGVYEKLV